MRERGNIFIAALKQTWIWVILAALMPVSCQNETEMDDAGTSGVTLLPTIASNVENVIHTRGTMSVLKSDETYDDDVISNIYAESERTTIIGVYAVPSNEEANVDKNLPASKRAQGSFRYSGGKWRSSVTVESGLAFNYNLYAFVNLYDEHSTLLPGAENQDFNWGKITQKNNQQEDVVVLDTTKTALTFTNLNLVTASDPIANVAASGRSSTVPGTPAITKGEFGIGRVIADVEHNQYYRVWMAMEHLYAKATLSFRLASKYSDIREIRIREAHLIVTEGQVTGNHSYNFLTGLSLDNDVDFADKELDINLLWGGVTANDNRTVSSDYVILTTDYVQYAWFCFLPISYIPEAKQTDYPSAKLVFRYDVVYTDIDGTQKVARDCETTNNFPLNSFKRTGGADKAPEPGDNFNVKITIDPTYLYQLTDGDATFRLDIKTTTE